MLLRCEQGHFLETNGVPEASRILDGPTCQVDIAGKFENDGKCGAYMRMVTVEEKKDWANRVMLKGFRPNGFNLPMEGLDDDKPKRRTRRRI